MDSPRIIIISVEENYLFGWPTLISVNDLFAQLPTFSAKTKRRATEEKSDKFRNSRFEKVELLLRFPFYPNSTTLRSHLDIPFINSFLISTLAHPSVDLSVRQSNRPSFCLSSTAVVKYSNGTQLALRSNII